MGAKTCRELGIDGNVVVSNALFESVWSKLDTKHRGELSSKDATTFLKTFARAVGIPWRPAAAKAFISQHLQEVTEGSSQKKITRVQFKRLLVNVSQAGGIPLSQSMAVPHLPPKKHNDPNYVPRNESLEVMYKRTRESSLAAGLSPEQLFAVATAAGVGEGMAAAASPVSQQPESQQTGAPDAEDSVDSDDEDGVIDDEDAVISDDDSDDGGAAAVVDDDDDGDADSDSQMQPQRHLEFQQRFDSFSRHYEECVPSKRNTDKRGKRLSVYAAAATASGSETPITPTSSTSSVSQPHTPASAGSANKRDTMGRRPSQASGLRRRMARESSVAALVEKDGPSHRSSLPFIAGGIVVAVLFLLYIVLKVLF